MPSGASRNQTLAPPADDIVRAFDRAAERARDRVLVLSPTWQTTAGHLDDWSRQAAARIGDAALAPGSIVGLVAASGPAFLAGFLGVRRAGCTALLLDITAATADRARVLDAVGASALLFCEVDAGATRFAAALERLSGPRAVDPRPDWAVIQMTSGSTGTPRGVALTSRALLADEDALARTMGIRETDRILAALPMSHRYGFTTLSLAAFARGCQLVMPADAGPLAPIHAGAACGATVFPTVPAYLQALLRMSQPPPWPASLRLCLTAGAPLPPATASQFREFSGRPVHVFYGASECGGICYDRSGDAGERGTVGTPVEGVSIAIMPAEGQDADGLLSVTSEGVGDSYVPAPDARLGGGRFLTADLGAWRGAEIELLRRADRIINVRGFKVDPVEVEHVIASLAGVDEVVVTGTAGPDGPGTLIRAVVASRSGAINAAAITAWCRPRLAEHKVPRSVAIVNALPRTARGKVDRAALDHA